MAAGAPTILEKVDVTLGGTSLTDVKKVTISDTPQQKERAVFGDVATRAAKGLGSWTVTIEGIQGYGASESYATILGKVGTNVVLVIDKDSSAAVSPTNPRWQMSRAYLANAADLDVEVGEDPVYSLEFMSAGSAISRLTAS